VAQNFLGDFIMSLSRITGSLFLSSIIFVTSYSYDHSIVDKFPLNLSFETTASLLRTCLSNDPVAQAILNHNADAVSRLVQDEELAQKIFSVTAKPKSMQDLLFHDRYFIREMKDDELDIAKVKSIEASFNFSYLGLALLISVLDETKRDVKASKAIIQHLLKQGSDPEENFSSMLSLEWKDSSSTHIFEEEHPILAYAILLSSTEVLELLFRHGARATDEMIEGASLLKLRSMASVMKKYLKS
jgi:hypothetical protein